MKVVALVLFSAVVACTAAAEVLRVGGNQYMQSSGLHASSMCGSIKKASACQDASGCGWCGNTTAPQHLAGGVCINSTAATCCGSQGVACQGNNSKCCSGIDGATGGNYATCVPASWTCCQTPDGTPYQCPAQTECTANGICISTCPKKGEKLCNAWMPGGNVCCKNAETCCLDQAGQGYCCPSGKQCTNNKSGCQ